MSNKRIASVSRYLKIAGIVAGSLIIGAYFMYLPSVLPRDQEIRYSYMNVAIHPTRVCTTIKAEIQLFKSQDKYLIKVNGYPYPTLTIVDRYSREGVGVVDTDGIYRTMLFIEDDLIMTANDVSIYFSNDESKTLRECYRQNN